MRNSSFSDHSLKRLIVRHFPFLRTVYRRVLYPAYRNLPDPLYRIVDTCWHRHESDSGGARYLYEYFKWQKQLRFEKESADDVAEKVTVILLSFKRVQNMQSIVRGLLKAPFVEKIIVSNNNPEYDITRWISLKDPRLRLINQSKPTAPGMRFELARQEPGKYFLSIDDDVFLYPSQVRRLIKACLNNSGSPYGVQGENRNEAIRPENDSSVAPDGWESGLSGFNRQVDVLNRVYAFTREHLEEMYRLAKLLGIAVGELANGEDILLSFSGRSRPFMVDVGKILSCLSQDRDGIATWSTRNGFFQERSRLYDRLMAATGRRAAEDPVRGPAGAGDSVRRSSRGLGGSRQG